MLLSSIVTLPLPLISSPLRTFSKQGASFASCAYANFFVRPASCLFSLCAGINRRVVCGWVFRTAKVRHHAGLESCVAIRHDLGPGGLIFANSDSFSSRLLEGVCVRATVSMRLPPVQNSKVTAQLPGRSGFRRSKRSTALLRSPRGPIRSSRSKRSNSSTDDDR
jgi:hypothetical protein